MQLIAIHFSLHAACPGDTSPQMRFLFCFLAFAHTVLLALGSPLNLCLQSHAAQSPTPPGSPPSSQTPRLTLLSCLPPISLTEPSIPISSVLCYSAEHVYSARLCAPGGRNSVVHSLLHLFHVRDEAGDK